MNLKNKEASGKLNIVRFAPRGKDSFFESVIEDVNKYFESNKISPHANSEMWIKTIAMLSLYLIPYLLVVTGIGSVNLILFYSLWFLMGLGVVGIGTSVMHDANHGAYSSSKKVNNIISYTLEIIGGYSVNWRIQHNVLHHTYTNVSGLDDDINSTVLLRFSPRQPLKWYHRYQHIYVWFFYSILTLFWMTAKDYVKTMQYKRQGLLAKEKISFRNTIFRITLYKTFYSIYILVLPLLFSGLPWYHVVFGFLVMHVSAGLILSLVFQPAHVVENSPFAPPVVSEDGVSRMEETWAIHEVVNTTDFAQRNKILTWFIGGLNYQIEHHLFSGVCHVHYPKLAPIVKSATAAYGIPYNVEPSFRSAIREHLRMIRKLGTE